MKVVSSKEMQTLDRRTTREYGLSSLILMENAGERTIARLATLFAPLKGKSILIMTGTGNNGGDGLVLARHLLQAESFPVVYLIKEDQSLKKEAKTNLDIFKKIGGRVFSERRNSHQLESLIQQSDLIVDAIFGTGLSRPIEGKILEIIQKINVSGKKVVSLDIPTGISADTGTVLGEAIIAEYTITYGLPKRGHYLFPGASYRGKLFIEDIGIPQKLIEESRFTTELLDRPLIRRIFPKSRLQDSHKGNFGHLVVIAGSRGKRGAGALCCKAALRSGVGLVTWALPNSLNYPDAFVPEAMTFPLPETSEGSLSLKAEDPLLSLAKNKDTVAIGPGLSTHPETKELIKRLILQLNLPVILDADGINALASEEVLKKTKGPILLTPHPGEMARLIGLDVQTVQKDKMTLLPEITRQSSAYLLLKGAYSLLCCPDQSLFINTTGNPGMATAGTGDVLTGMIAGLSAQGIPVRDAAKIGVYLHGLAGDLALKKTGETSMIASDLIEKIPDAIQRLTQSVDKET